MKYFFKFLFFLILSLSNKKRFIILVPNLTFIGINKVYIYDKNQKKFLNFFIEDKYDYITVQEIFFYECYKIDSFQIFEKIKKYTETKNILIIDCGSNIGCSTSYFLNTYTNSKIISIEPDKRNFDLLKKNILDGNVKLINNAISSEAIKYEILDNKDSRAKSIIKSDKDNLVKSLTINEILDDQNYKNLDPFLIKIDIEGHEKDLFNSNTEWFNRFKIIIIEIHDWMLPEQNISKKYFNTLVNSMKVSNRDIIIKGENIISIKL